jgi:hypothetical protein
MVVRRHLPMKKNDLYIYEDPINPFKTRQEKHGHVFKMMWRHLELKTIIIRPHRLTRNTSRLLLTANLNIFQMSNDTTLYESPCQCVIKSNMTLFMNALR